MKKMNLFQLISNLSLIGQLGITFVLPFVGFTLLGVLLYNQVDAPLWVLLLCIGVGFLTAISSFISFINTSIKQMQRQEQKEKEEQNGTQENHY